MFGSMFGNYLNTRNYVDKDGLQLVVGRDYLAIRKSDDRGIICEVENKNINGITRNIPISCLFNVTAKSDKFIEEYVAVEPIYP